MTNLKNLTIFYTGAAGGLGHDTTLYFLSKGAFVIAVDHNKEKLDALAKSIPAEQASQFLAIEADLGDHETYQKIAKKACERGVDVVINNAAIYPSKSFEDYSLADYQNVQKINVEACIIAVKAALPHMKKQQFGRIINIASVTMNGEWEGLYPYVASKATLVGLTRAWAREFGKDGITVNAVSPGAFPTDAEKIHPNPEIYNQFVLDRQSVKRRGTPKDIATILTYLASNEAGFITGQTINVDGGWVMN